MDKMLLVAHKTKNTYTSSTGYVMERESKFNDNWVLRDIEGVLVDSGRYRYDLAQVNNMQLSEH